MTSEGQQLINSNLKNILLKLEEVKSLVKQHDCVDHQCQINEMICKRLSEFTTAINNLADSNELKFYKLCEEISVVYFQLKQMDQVQLDQNILEVFFSYFKTEITQSDHYHYQVSQNMVVA